MAAHSYWRIYITANNGDATYTDVNELEFRATVGGTDQCSGGTSLAGSSYNSADNAFDNNTSQYWIGQGGLPNYVGYHFASAVNVTQIAVTSPWNGEQTRAPKDFDVQFSDDGSTWTTAHSVTGETAWANQETRLFTIPSYTLSGNITESMAVTKWRITATQCSNGGSAGSVLNSGTTYTLNVSTGEPCNITLSPHIDRKWSTGITPAAGEFWVPSNPDTTPRLYECTTSGAVGGSEPTWPTSGTVNDGSAVWTFVCDLDDGMFKTLGTKIPA